MSVEKKNPTTIILQEETTLRLGPSLDSEAFVLKEPIKATPVTENTSPGWQKLTIEETKFDKLAAPKSQMTVYLAIPEPQPTA